MLNTLNGIILFVVCFTFPKGIQSQVNTSVLVNSEFDLSPLTSISDESIKTSEKLPFQKSKNYCSYIKNDSLVKLYKDVVFNNANYGIYDPVITMQWKSRIIIYLDKSIPKKIRKNFIGFFQQINDIENLNIEFTRNIEKANYLIKNTSEDLLTKMNLYDKEDSYPLSHVYYNLLSDNNSKFFGGTLSINLDAITDKSLILPKLKQLFFISLGQFVIDRNVEKNSLLRIGYENTTQISKKDLTLLKLHYIQLHDKPLSCLSYSKFITKLKLNCLDE